MSFQPPNSLAGSSHLSQSLSEGAEYSAEERRLLLRLAHDAVESLVLEHAPGQERSGPHLDEPRGVFTTLYLHGKLRGCVGYVVPVLPLQRAVFETARAAASQDTRFPPVRRDEVRDLQLSLSILSPLFSIQAAEVKIGRHGLVVTSGARRGLLLPQVPVEHGWTREEFLEQTCRKAGLYPDAWKSGATLEAFTAEVFGDPGAPE
jgi:AmmeMemoRadiSam system protein A